MTSLRSGPLDRKNIIYIVTGTNLVNDLVTYTSTYNSRTYKNEGTFTTPLSASNITKGYLLVDTGKRLVPGQQPNVPTLLIGVYVVPLDSNGRRLAQFPVDQNGSAPVNVMGFIDPNSPNVAIYSRDRSIDYNDNLYFSGATNLNRAGAAYADSTKNTTDFTISANGSGVRHLGPSVYTGGLLTAAGGITASNAFILQSGPFVPKLVTGASNTVLAGITTSNTIDLSIGTTFFYTYAGSSGGNIQYTVSNAIPGAVFNIATNNCNAGTLSNTFTGATIYINNAVTGGTSFTVGPNTRALTFLTVISVP